MKDLTSRATAMMKSLAGGEVEDIRPYLHDDVVWNVPPSAGKIGLPTPLVGKESVVTLLGGLFVNTFKPLNVEVAHLVEQGQNVVLVCNIKGEARSGAKYQNVYAFFFRFEGELIIEAMEFVDTMHSMDQLAPAEAAH